MPAAENNPGSHSRTLAGLICPAAEWCEAKQQTVKAAPASPAAPCRTYTYTRRRRRCRLAPAEDPAPPACSLAPGAMDSSAATAALAAVAAAGMWQGCSLFILAGDPVPYYDDP